MAEEVKSWEVLAYSASFWSKRAWGPRTSGQVFCFSPGAPIPVFPICSTFLHKTSRAIWSLLVAETISSCVKPCQRTAGFLVQTEHFSPPTRDHSCESAWTQRPGVLACKPVQCPVMGAEGREAKLGMGVILAREHGQGPAAGIARLCQPSGRPPWPGLPQMRACPSLPTSLLWSGSLKLL